MLFGVGQLTGDSHQRDCGLNSQSGSAVYHLCLCPCTSVQGCGVLVFYGTPTQTPGLENLGLQTPTLARLLTPTPGLKSDSDSRFWDLLCDIMIVYLKTT